MITQCQTVVDDHRAYKDKLKAIDNWLVPLEQNLQALQNEEINEDLEVKRSRMQMLLAEREQAEHRLAGLAAAGEKILPDTSAQGRETIRQELRRARERWDHLAEGIASQQKKQDAQSLQWTSYLENLQQILLWLDTMESSIKQDSSAIWSSLQEVRSKLLKYKVTNQLKLFFLSVETNESVIFA